MIILGIETSCDETSAALLNITHGHFEILSQVLSSSMKKQIPYGGIVPEVAARKQMEYMIPVLNEALKTGNPKPKILNPKQIQSIKTKKTKPLEFRVSNLEFVTAIAVTVGPGLATALQVGIDTAKTLAYVWQKPLILINHLEGHLLSPLLTQAKKITNNKLQITNKSKIQNLKSKIQFPAVALIVSGGHTELILVKNYLDYKLLGRTRDDAVGEAFDKVARMLGMAYPGGPKISKQAKKGNPKTFDFPRGMIDSGDYDFSFSGLKTAVLYKLKELKKAKKLISYKLKSDLCASFQQAAIDVLVTKTMKAVQEYKAKTLLVGGGVAANPLLRKASLHECQILDACPVESDSTGVSCSLTPLAYSGDNAAMIALAGYFRYKNENFLKPDPQNNKWQTIKAQPNLRLA